MARKKILSFDNALHVVTALGVTKFFWPTINAIVTKQRTDLPITTHNRVSETGLDEINQALNKIPQEMRAVEAQDSVTIETGPILSETYGMDQGECFLPTLYDSRINTNQIGASFSSNVQTNEGIKHRINIAEYYFDPNLKPNVTPLDPTALNQTAELERYNAEFFAAARNMTDMVEGTVNASLLQKGLLARTNIAYAVPHEFGHSVFNTYKIGQNPSYLAAWQHDIDNLGGRQKAIDQGLEYYVFDEGTDRGRNEVFADGFTEKIDPSVYTNLNKHYFPNSRAWISRFVEDFSNYAPNETYQDISGYAFGYPATSDETILQAFNTRMGTFFVRKNNEGFSLTGPNVAITATDPSSPISIINDQSGLITLRGNTTLDIQRFAPNGPLVSSIDNSSTVIISSPYTLHTRNTLDAYLDNVDTLFPQNATLPSNSTPIAFQGTFSSFTQNMDITVDSIPTDATDLGNILVQQTPTNASIKTEAFSITSPDQAPVISILDTPQKGTLRIYGIPTKSPITINNPTTSITPLQDGEGLQIAYGANTTNPLTDQTDPLLTNNTTPFDALPSDDGTLSHLSIGDLGVYPSLGFFVLGATGILLHCKHKEQFVGTNRQYVASKLGALKQKIKDTTSGTLVIKRRGSKIIIKHKRPEGTRPSNKKTPHAPHGPR